MTCCVLCLLDARQWHGLRDVIVTMKRVGDSVRKKVLVFLLSFPAQPHIIRLWRQVLIKTFSDKQGYKNVRQYYLENGEGSLGQAVILLGGDMNANARLSHVQFMRAPPGSGFAKFGDAMIYVELQYNESQGAPSRTIGVLWTPDLFCDGKYYFSDDNYRGVVGFLKATTLLQRFDTLSGGTRTLDLHEAQSLLQKHLAGFVLITDMRSEYFGERMPIHQWKMSGIAHVVNGTIMMNGEFVDTNACSIGCLPSCYKIRLMHQNLRGNFWVTNRSFDFWSDDIFAIPSQISTSAKDRTFGRTIVESHGAGTSSDSTTAESHGGGSVVSSPAGFVLQDDEVESECMVCLSRPPTHVFERCGHLGPRKTRNSWNRLGPSAMRVLGTTNRLTPTLNFVEFFVGG